MNDIIVSKVTLGKCQEFCPQKEYKLRIREKLVHKYEYSEQGFQLVKQYSRPAAGQSGPNERELRSPATLVNCVRYLMCQVMQPQMKNFELQDLYDFLFDRLRSVRQDLVVQSAPDDVQLHILATCVRFHLVFGHLLAQHSTFSQHLNSQHQLECLKSCLVLGETSSSSSSSRSQEESDMETMQCLYLLTNLDSPHALNWAVNTQTRSEKLERCFQLALSYREGNFVKFFRYVSYLPTLQLISVYKYCKLMLEHAASACRLAYKSPNLKYPASHLAKLLWIKSDHRLKQFLTKKGFKVENGSVWFGVSNGTAGEDIDSDLSDCYYSSVVENLDYHVNSFDKLILGHGITVA